MSDISKYLENQLSLAKQKNEASAKKKNLISSKSLEAAQKISKKQTLLVENEEDKCCNETVSLKSDISKQNSEDSDYLPSSDEDDNILVPKIHKISKISKKHIKKIVDDGDQQLFQERKQRWKTDFELAKSGDLIDIPSSADIQYVLTGNEDSEKNHELQNGFCIPNYIWKQLYKYQRTGVKWLWELHQTKSGGLLGDEMGLGKTVQIIAFLAGLSKSNIGTWNGLGPTIIIAPATVIFQWVSHFHYWCPHLRVAVLHHSGSHSGHTHRLIRSVQLDHGILVATYAGIVKYQKELLPRLWHYIILDEGHKIRNPDIQVSKLVKKFDTPHRILITGSPMQNNLQELWSLFDFMRPGLLGSCNAFMEYFAIPITQGGYANATEFQEATALEIARTLKNMITPYMLRRTKAEVQEHIKLPDKNEQVLFCSLSDEQRDLYMGYLTSATVRSILDREHRYGDPLRARILVGLTTLRKICNHPDLYLYEAQEEQEVVDEEKFGYYKRSGKMTVVHSLLKIWQKQNHRALIFSQSRSMLCILEQYLQKHDFKYLKMDGTVNVSQRQNIIKMFNENSDYLVFLATTRVGGLGVNLTGADRVIIYDPDWNPATDSQAKERAWRIGQLRNVTVYRLLSAGTIEEKMYQRQVFKQLLSNKVLLDHNQKNILTTSTLQGLFTLEDLNQNGDTETSSLFSHTKVNVKQYSKNKNNKEDSKHLSYSQKKMEAMRKREAMRRMAREISRKISSTVTNNNSAESIEDPREKYKKKRELLLNPPKEEEPQINVIDDQITNVPFDNVLSELDIINRHAKQNYEEILIESVLNNNETDTELLEPMPSTSKDTEQNLEDKVNEEGNKQTKKTTTIEIKKSKKRKCKIESVVAIKKMKKDKRQSSNEKSDDDYVLSKLFAKSTVKNALQHDVVVGLAEKEKRFKLKEEAAKKARHAVRALKISLK